MIGRKGRATLFIRDCAGQLMRRLAEHPSLPLPREFSRFQPAQVAAALRLLMFEQLIARAYSLGPAMYALTDRGRNRINKIGYRVYPKTWEDEQREKSAIVS
jgi:hypothetical protein